MSPLRLERRIPATFGAVEALCLHLRALLGEAGAPSREAFALELLAREALSNAVRHGCQADPSREVAFRFRQGRRRALLRVDDDGPGFPWRTIMTRPADDEASSGRGLAIFRAYATRLAYNDAGNRLLLIRALPEPSMTQPDPAPSEATALLHPGDLTASTVDGVRAKLKALLEGGARQVILDLAGVHMIDSMGIGLLIQAHNSLTRQGGALVVRHASPDLLDLFRSMRLDQRFTLEA